MARLTSIKVGGVDIGRGPRYHDAFAASPPDEEPAELESCSRCGDFCGRHWICPSCAITLKLVGDMIAVAAGYGWKNAKLDYNNVRKMWHLQVGGPVGWSHKNLAECILDGVRYLAGRANEFGERVVRAAQVGRTDSISQKEHDRLQDTVSKAIEALGVELKYA